MLLVDWQIEKWLIDGGLVIDPPPTVFQPASVDLHIDARVKRWRRDHWEDFREESSVHVGKGECVLACTRERVVLPECLAARVEGKSSLGRLFLFVHVTAGFIDNGFGTMADSITLELVNSGPTDLWIPVGAPICQISFMKTAQPCGTYGGHYAKQAGPTVSRYEDWRTKPAPEPYSEQVETGRGFSDRQSR